MHNLLCRAARPSVRRLSVALLAIAAARVAPAQTVPPRAAITITHVSVVDVATAGILPDRDVVVRDGRIVAVDSATAGRTATASAVIDGRGKFLIPGLWDMHVHLGTQGIATKVLFPMQIANGITGVREMTSDCYGRPGCALSMTIDTVVGWRREIAAGRLAGPRILASSPMLDGPTPTWAYGYPIANAEAARSAVRLFKARGVDFLKVYSLIPRDAFLALADEAKKVGLPFAGHEPLEVTTREASDAGMASLEHGHGLQEGCSSREPALRAEQRRLIDLLISARDHNLLTEPIYVEQAHAAFASFDETKCHELFATFVRNHTAQTPTLVLLQSWAAEHDPARLRDPRMRYVPRVLRDAWEAFADAPQADVPDERTVRKERLWWIEEMIGEMQRAGVPILAGTEQGGASFIHPGFAIHDELELLAQSGLTAGEALRAATLTPAQFFNATDTLGTVARGKRADLVLLDANPLVDIRNTRAIRAVIADGRLYDRAALDALLAGVAAIAAR